VRQLLTESATLTVMGGALGVLVSYWAVGGIRGLGVRVLPRMDAVSLDWRVLLFAISGTLLTALLGGIAPALAGRRVSARVSETVGNRATGQGTSSALVIVQICLSVVLLVGAGLLVRSFLRVVPDDPGFALENRATLSVALRGLPAFPDTDRVATRAFVHDVIERMRGIPGVRDVAMVSFPPFFGSASISEVEIPGRPASDKPLTAFQNLVTANFFDVMRIPIRMGRAFTTLDTDGAERVAIVNETAAARWWPNASPIGRQLMLSRARERFAVTIVGVVADGRLIGTDTRIRPELFLPVSQGDPRFISFIAHTAGAPKLYFRDLQRAVWAVAPRLPIGTTSDMATIANDSVRRERFFSWAMGTFAAVAVVLSALAVYGLLAFAVVQRRQEIGIRMALGATSRRVGFIVLRRAVGLGVAGVIPGVLIARALSRFMESLLLEVSATDATVFLGTAISVLVVAVVAACAPVYQATRVNPIESLRM
jgi:predicted permease